MFIVDFNGMNDFADFLKANKQTCVFCDVAQDEGKLRIVCATIVSGMIARVMTATTKQTAVKDLQAVISKLPALGITNPTRGVLKWMQ